MKTELLDDLKGAWNEAAKETLSDEVLQRELAALWRKRSNSTRLKFLMEVAGYVLIYSGAVVVIVLASADTTSQIFGVKIILLSLLFFTPVVASLYQSMTLLRQADLTQPMGAFVEASIRQLRKSERLYLSCSYLFSLFMLVLLATDEFFNRQALWLRVTVFVFVVLFALVVRPYVRLTYARDRRYFEQLKGELDSRE